MTDPSAGTEIAPGVTLSSAALQWRFARSSGPGGQNVNKLNTKAVLSIDLADLEAAVPPAVFARLTRLAGHFLLADRLQLTSEDSRSQHANRQACLEKLRALIVRAQVRPKKRKPTRPTRGSVERRLKAKQARSDTKRRRRRPNDDH